jgi:hypothetical protein
MKIITVAAFCAAAFIVSPMFAFATTHWGDTQGKPIQGTDVGLDHDPGNIVVSHSLTNSAGLAVFQNVKPGRYAVTIGSIDWGDGNQRENGLTKVGAGVLILVSGQRTAAFTISRTHTEAKGPKTDEAHGGGTRDERRFAFAVTGNQDRTVTVRLTHEVKSPRDMSTGGA